MAESFTKFASQDFFSRLWESIRGVSFGMLLFVIGFPVLFGNEIHAVVDRHRLQSGRAAFVEVPPDEVNADNQDALVYTSDRATIGPALLSHATLAIGSKRAGAWETWVS